MNYDYPAFYNEPVNFQGEVLMAATNDQVQRWANEMVRPFCEDLRAILLKMEDANSRIGDVYANLTDAPNWADNRTDGPPHLLTPSDVLAINTVCVQLSKILRGGTFADDAAKVAAVNDVAAQLPIALKACVRSVSN